MEVRHQADVSRDDEELPEPSVVTAVSKQYLWDARYIDAAVVRWYDQNADSDFSDEFEMLYYSQDANFNVTALYHPSGWVAERYEYDAYGKVRIMDGSFASRSSSLYDNVYLYTGRELDDETGLYHYRNRYYHAELGRFLSRDPIGYGGGDVNLCRYVGNGPPTYTDPNGTWPWYPSGTYQECIDEVENTYEDCLDRGNKYCIVVTYLKCKGKLDPRVSKIFLTCVLAYSAGCEGDRGLGYGWCKLWFWE